MTYRTPVMIVVGQSCTVHYDGYLISTSVREISPGNFLFSVQPHKDFPGIQRLKFSMNKISSDCGVKCEYRHYAFDGTGNYVTKVWVEF